MNLPLGQLAKRLTEINDLKQRPVILACRTDKRSANASALLQRAGFHDVRILRGGMVEWNRRGLPIEDGDVGKSKTDGQYLLNPGANQ